MIIKLTDNYQISTDSLNYILQKRVIVTKGENEGKERIENVGYYGKIENLLNALLEIKIKDLDIDSIASLRAEISQLEGFIKEQVSLIEKQLEGVKTIDR